MMRTLGEGSVRDAGRIATTGVAVETHSQKGGILKDGLEQRRLLLLH